MKLALGTVQFGLPYGVANQGEKVSRSEAAAIMNLAKKNGINTLDTAIVYGNSELTLGSIGVEGWRIVTKLPEIPVGVADVFEWVERQVEGSLSRLGQKKLYGLLLHRPEQLLTSHCGPRFYDALRELKKCGLVEKIGISVYQPGELDILLRNMQFDLVQAPFNILDRRMVDSGWLIELKRRNIEVHVRSIFLQGLLLQSAEKRPSKFMPWQELWRVWDDWLYQNKVTPLQACLRYVHLFPEIDRIIVGVDTVAQLDQILHAAAGKIPAIPRSLWADDVNLLNPSRW